MASSKVILNIGGEKYTTSIETLTARDKETSFFTELFARQWQLERDPKDDSLFIDRNGKLFAHVLEYLRTGTVPSHVKNDSSLCESLISEADYFRLPQLQNLLAKPTFPDSTLFETQAQKEKLNEFYGKAGQQWELIYKATRDGFSAKSFHSKCDGKSPTMTIIQSDKKFLFGGYTSVPWSSGNFVYKKDTQAFIFTLTNPHNIPPTKYSVKPDYATNAVVHHNAHGPAFGGGYCRGSDIELTGNSNATNVYPRSSSSFPNCYDDTTEMKSKTFTGTSDFVVADFEVFKLVQ